MTLLIYANIHSMCTFYLKECECAFPSVRSPSECFVLSPGSETNKALTSNSLNMLDFISCPMCVLFHGLQEILLHSLCITIKPRVSMHRQDQKAFVHQWTQSSSIILQPTPLLLETSTPLLFKSTKIYKSKITSSPIFVNLLLY